MSREKWRHLIDGVKKKREKDPEPGQFANNEDAINQSPFRRITTFSVAIFPK